MDPTRYTCHLPLGRHHENMAPQRLPLLRLSHPFSPLPLGTCEPINGHMGTCWQEHMRHHVLIVCKFLVEIQSPVLLLLLVVGGVFKVEPYVVSRWYVWMHLRYVEAHEPSCG